jgi:hypothetical protein
MKRAGARDRGLVCSVVPVGTVRFCTCTAHPVRGRTGM